ncbi:MAG: hypothetical protein P8P29_06340 [Flavobacteriaceae bacterium]|nr:hypothetical protein [Flavobacteriaceae bacterium]
MNTKSFILSGIVGTLVSFLLGFLFYGLLFTDIHPDDAEQCMVFISLGCLFYAFTFALIYNRWANISTFKTGAEAGFLIGLLWSLSMNFFIYSSGSSLDSNFLLLVAIDAVSATIMGGLIALVIGKVKS